ncbi:hypothetical protein CLU79DRAFT_43303 [Phycomyces nitens]|nr:hypothetical protein CLU79DRAFT_43303 [Phycomyces nitens]
MTKELEPERIISYLYRMQKSIDIIIKDKGCGTQPDLLYSKGIQLWNAAVCLARDGLDTKDVCILHALLRHVGYYMIQLGATEQDSVLSLHMDMATKVAKAWINCGEYERADQGFEEAMRCKKKKSTKILASENTRQWPDQHDNGAELAMFMAELAARRGEWDNVEKLVNESLGFISISDEAKTQQTEFILRLCLNVGAELSRHSAKDSLWWLAKTAAKIDISMCNKYLQEDLLELATELLQRVSDGLPDALSSSLSSLISSVLVDTHNSLGYYTARLLAFINAENPDQPNIEKVYFEAMENYFIQKGDMDMIMYLLKSLQNHIQLDTLVSGLDLAIQRSLGTSYPKSDDLATFQTLSLFKLAFLARYVSSDNSAIDDFVQSTMNEVYLLREQMSTMDLQLFQMLMWRAGDCLYERKDYSQALVWYKHTWSICLSVFSEDQNTLVLARKLAMCYLKTEQPEKALHCLSESFSASAFTLEDNLPKYI